jgi:hypothetical protein
VYVPLRPICDYLGLAWNGQFQRINRDPVLTEAIKGVPITGTPGGRQEMTCLSSYKMLPGRRFSEVMKWLADWYSSITDEEVPF